MVLNCKTHERLVSEPRNYFLVGHTYLFYICLHDSILLCFRCLNNYQGYLEEGNHLACQTAKKQNTNNYRICCNNYDFCNRALLPTLAPPTTTASPGLSPMVASGFMYLFLLLCV